MTEQTAATEPTEPTQSLDLQERERRTVADETTELTEARRALNGGDPIPLDVSRVELPPFPVEALPGFGAAMVRAVAESMQVAVDMPGSVFLGILAATACGRAEVRARRDWLEPVGLYVLVTAASGERKSPTLRHFRQPLVEAERELITAWLPQRREAESARAMAEQAAANHRVQAAKKSITAEQQKKALAEAISLDTAVEGIVVPPQPRLLAGGDATPEAIAGLLAKHGGRLTILDAEGGLFDTLAGRYSSGRVANLDVVLAAYSGDPILIDRRGRDAERVERPALSIVLMCQPIVLARVAGDAEMSAKGLPARFLYALPESFVGSRKTGSDVEPIPEAIETAYRERIKELALSLAEWVDEPAILDLTPNALERLDKYEAEIEQRLGRGGDLSPIVAWGSKLAGQAVRLAGLLHVGENGSLGPRTPVSGDVMDRAIQLADYFADHARAALLSPDPQASDAAAVLTHLRQVRSQQFTIRDLQRVLSRSRFATADAVREAVAELQQHRWVAEVPQPRRTDRPGRPPSPVWVTHKQVSDQ